MSELTKYFTTVFFLSYMMTAFGWPSIRTWKQTGVNPITFGKSDNAHDFIGRWFKVLLGLVPLTIVVFWISKPAYTYLLPAPFLQVTIIQWTGIVICLLSLIWTVVAQAQMGNSWRIGIDERNKTKLVTEGLFHFSRNPIFLGMQLTLFGLFLLLPNAVTMLVLITGCMLIQIQVRLEEEYLLKQHGEDYSNYKKSVRRFL